jgi:hypothetical protein
MSSAGAADSVAAGLESPPVPQPYEKSTGRVAAEHGARPLGEAEASAILDLARVVAHTGDDRRAAPLVAYQVGQLLAGEGDEAARIARIGEIARGFEAAG